jgi:pimeloyl-ACP methyl ester carboxylesterase
MPPPLAVWWWVTQNWAAVAIIGTCVSLLIFVVLVLARYVRISLNIFTDTPPPLSMGPRDFQIMQGEQVRFRSFDGTSLRGMWLRTPARPGRMGVVVFCHEFGSDMYSCARYARPLIEAGFDVFTFDFRGHGDSSCPRGYRLLQWPSDRELGDVLGACAHVEDVLLSAGEPARVGIFGISRGAGAALLAASSDPNIACLVCDGAFSTQETLVALMKRWASIFARVKLVYENHPDAFWRFLQWCMMRFAQPRLGRRFPSVRKAVAHMVSRPILFIHGEKDSYLRSDQAYILYAAAAEPKSLWIVPHAKHNQSVVVTPAEYAARTVGFFRKHLAGEAVGREDLAGEEARTVVA